MRPPSVRIAQASGRARSSASSSPLTAIRIAWKVRLAGWPRPKRSDGGIAALIALTSWAVVSIGRRLVISRAIEPARRSSPSSRITLARRSCGQSLTTVAAERLCVGSIRMSSGAS